MTSPFKQIHRVKSLAITCAITILASLACAAPVPWTSPAPLNSGAFSDIRSDDGVAMESGDNTLLAAWWHHPHVPNTGGLKISRSLDSGRTWEPSIELPSTVAYNPPTPYYLGSGQWVISFDNNNQLRKSTDDGITWSAPYYINNTGGQVIQPVHALGTNKNGILVRARQILGPTNGLDQSNDGGITWTHNTEYTSYIVQKIVHSQGENWLLLTTGNQIHTSVDNARSWSNSSFTPPFTIRNIATNHNGTVVATSENTTTSDDQLSYTATASASQSTDNGQTWTPSVIVSSQTRNKTANIVSFNVRAEAHWLTAGKWAFCAQYKKASRHLILDVNRTETVDVIISQSEDNANTWDAGESVLQIGTEETHFASQLDRINYASIHGSLTLAWATDGDPTYKGPTGSGPDFDLLYKTRYVPHVAAAKDWSLYH